MANTLGILERTLAQVADKTNSINVIGTAGGRLSVYEPVVVRITDHEDNDAAETATDTEKMALFLSRRHGEQWEKQSGTLKHIIAKATAGSALTVNTTTVGNVITAVAIGANAGTAYAKGDTLTVATGTGALLLVTAVAAGVVTGLAILKGGTSYSNVTGAVTSGLIPTDVTNLYTNFDYSTFE
jgi:hypothetical protein